MADSQVQQQSGEGDLVHGNCSSVSLETDLAPRGDGLVTEAFKGPPRKDQSGSLDVRWSHGKIMCEDVVFGLTKAWEIDREQ